MTPPFTSDLEQDPFDGHEFIERIAWRATTADKFDNPDRFDAKSLHNAFLYSLQELKGIKDSYQSRCDRLEVECQKAEKEQWKNVRDLKDRFSKSINNFHSMNDRLDTVANKVHHLGQQLEHINRPRSRAAEAYKLFKQFGEFLDASYNPVVSLTASNKKAFFEDADIIHKLYLISQELPKTEKFERSREKIEQKYNLMERELIEEFIRAYRCNDKSQMKEIATIMSNFKGYNKCIDAFIEQSLMGVIIGNSPLDHREGFSEILPLCEKIQVIVRDVFKNPEEVMSKFLLNTYTGKLKDHIVHTMKIHDLEKYLNELYNQYTRTTRLSNQIISAKIVGSRDLEMLTRRIFSEYLNTYFKTELTSLRERCASILNRYYESKNHQKKAATMSSLQDIKNKFSRAKNLNISGLANINVNIGQLANINITGPGANDPLPPGETLLSEEVAICLLHEVKLALNRSKELSKPNEAENAVEIFEIQLQHLCKEHLEYAIELGREMMNLEQKNQPDLRFFDIVRQCNAICHLLEKQFVDCVQPQVTKTESKKCYSDCVKRKREILDQLEFKLNDGLEKLLNTCINWIRTTLTAEQKKTDFKPENEELTPAVSTSACSKVCKFVKSVTGKILDCLDGENVTQVYTEFGVRFHKVICEHLQKFEFSSIGAMVAISDVKAYSNAIRIPHRDASSKALPDDKIVGDKFKILHSLCNLWVVPPENLKQLCGDDGLAGVDRGILDTFVQLRVDFRSSRLLNQFKF